MENKKKLVVRVWYFENGDESGTMHTADFETEESYNDFMGLYEGSIEIFTEKEIWI